MKRIATVLTIVLAIAGTACSRNSRLQSPPSAPTVLKVENQGFPDMNIFVVPAGGSRVRLGTVTGNSSAYFTLPDFVVRGSRELRFQALPIATPRGELSQSIFVTPGDTVQLVIPPS